MSDDERRGPAGPGRDKYGNDRPPSFDGAGGRGGFPRDSYRKGPPRRGYDDGFDRRRRDKREFDDGFDHRGAGKRRRFDDDDVPMPAKKSESREEEEPISFREFLLRQRDDISPEEAKEKYDAYLVEVRKRQPHYFFDDHKHEEWFRDRYHPGHIRARAKLIREETVQRATAFAKKLQEEGVAAFREMVSEEEGKEQTKQDKSDTEVHSRERKHGESNVKEENGVKDEAKTEDRREERQENTDNSNTVEDTLFIRNVPPKVTRAQLLEGLSCNGRFRVKKLRIGDVNPQRGLTRFAWGTYESAEDARAACDSLRDISITEQVEPKEGEENQPEPSILYKFEASINKERDREKKMHAIILPKIAASAPRLKYDREVAEKVMRHLDAIREVGEQNPLTTEFLETLGDTLKELDMVLHYLYDVQLYSYYSYAEFADDPSSMPPAPLRPRMDPNAEIALSGSGEKGTWEKKVDDRADQILHRKSEKPKNGASDAATLRNRRLQEWFDANTRVEGEGRVRCALPPYKLFKGVEYVHKHLRLRHVDAMEKILQEADEEQFLENYLNDPHKLDASSIQENQQSGPRFTRGYDRGGGAGYGYGRGPMAPMRGRGRMVPFPGQFPLDPRASRAMPEYNDLDAPADGPKIQLVKYEDR